MNNKERDQYYYRIKNHDRKNIYTNRNLHNGVQDIKYFSSPRPLSAEQPYIQKNRLSDKYYRQSSKKSNNYKPLKIGLPKVNSQQNIRLYYSPSPEKNITNTYRNKNLTAQNQKKNTKQNEKPQKQSYKYKSNQKNIYVAKNFDTSYGKGNFKGNYQNLLQAFSYHGQNLQQQQKGIGKKDLYTKYKQKQPFKLNIKSKNQFNPINQLCKSPTKNPYITKNQDYTFRSKSSSNKFLHRFHWKLTTQHIRKQQI